MNGMCAKLKLLCSVGSEHSVFKKEILEDEMELNQISKIFFVILYHFTVK
jgi:hypothetical protein